MKTKLLTAFKSELKKLGIEAAHRVYKGKTYPYLTYEYATTFVAPEYGGTTGELLCEVWTRGKFADLTGIDEKMQAHFQQLNIKTSDGVCHFDYMSSTPEDTGDSELKKLQIIVATQYWKGA